jgi:Holliday junction resolvase RusA-like endonuclease
MSSFQFRDLTKANADAWFIAKGFVREANGSWSKPKRTVPRVRAEAAAVAEPVALRPQHDSPQREAIYPGRVLVCVTSYCCGRQRDADNILAKFGIDCCRHAGIISDDSPEHIELVVKEKRVSTKKEEGFEIVITPL